MSHLQVVFLLVTAVWQVTNTAPITVVSVNVTQPLIVMIDIPTVIITINL